MLYNRTKVRYTMNIIIDKHALPVAVSSADGPKFGYPGRIAGSNGTHLSRNRNWYSP